MEKCCFALNIEDGWPPVSTETVWCERSGDQYVLKNVPFFIEGLALEDKFNAEPDSVNGCIFEFEVVEESGNSLIWIMNNDNLDFSAYDHKLCSLGCRMEGFPQFSLFAVNVPVSTDIAEINALVDEIEQDGFALAFPVWRHEPAGASQETPSK